MGLLSMLKRLRKETAEARVVILGLDKSGKTTIVRALSHEDTQIVVPTQGFTVKVLRSDGIRLDVWECGGQKAIRPFWRNYLDRTDALIYVVDSSDKLRLEEAAIELRLVLEETQLRKAPLLVLANKQDLPDSLEPSAITEGLSLMSLRTHPWHIEVGSSHAISVLEGCVLGYFNAEALSTGCSGKEGVGLDHGINWLLQQITPLGRSMLGEEFSRKA